MSAPPTEAPSSIPASSRPGTTEDSLKAYRLLEALRKGDAGQIVPLLEDSATAPRAEGVSETGVLSGTTSPGTATPLHLAIRVAKYPTVELVLKRQPRTLNSQDGRGQTPLHLAAALDRRDVLSLLLEQDDADDTVRDQSGKNCLEVAATAEAAGIISASRNKLNEIFLAHLAAYVASPTSDSASASNRASTLISSSPRLSTSSQLPPTTTTPTQGSSGPPPTVSAASGHVSNGAAEKLYHLIAKPRAASCDFSLRDPSSGTTILHEAVRRKDLGLIKLVLARGGDALARDRRGKAAIDLAKDERIRSVLRQRLNSEGMALQAGAASGAEAPQRGPPALKGYLTKWVSVAKGGYKPRWFVLENGVLSYYRHQEDEGRASRGSISMSVAKLDPPGSDKLKFTVSNKLGGKSAPAFYLKGNHPVEVMRWCDALRQSIDLATGETGGLTRSNTVASLLAAPVPSGGAGIARRPSSSAYTDGFGSPADSDRANSIDDDNDTVAEEDDIVPHADDFHLMEQSTKTQLELAQKLLGSLGASNGSDVKDALGRSLVSLDQLFDDYVGVVNERERFFARRYEKEVHAKRMWEESMKEVAAQHAAIEVELHKASRENTRRKRALQEVRANLGAVSPGLSPRASIVGEEERPDLRTLPTNGDAPLPSPLRSPTIVIPPSSSRGNTGSGSPARRTPVSLSPTRMRSRAATMQPLAPAELEQIVQDALANEEGVESSDEDTDDEFFEAVEAGNLPLDDAKDDGAKAESDASAPKRTAPAQELVDKLDMAPYKGYERLRDKLPITNDDRPAMSLWSILKSNIGKDLTKISFPVSFNEPVSMLERMAEDMEFSECLDAAAAESDSTKRIAFVAAFAMSNYSSTIGRIAKPFNPLLGETFEYVNTRKKYRYQSEQVSHHPPMSACMGQSPSWDYFGTVDAKSKFTGKSFEIRPTGVAHVVLRIPEEWADPSCPPNETLPGMREEHYSWVKVTTSVSNFIFGSPIIDHYGDMVITNHRTGETCTLTFKPRGWRGGNVAEIKGDVKDKSGHKHWDIAGTWASQLVARRAGAGKGDLAPDATLPTDGTGDVAPEYIRLWKNSTKPPGSPFNLTPYAITLNDINPDLKPWLPPTDCRLRPDQHAFESGKFDRANELKAELEEHQRATRRARERGEVPPHQPRWFSRSTDADTGEVYWQPAKTAEGKLAYWEERLRVGKAKLEGQDVEWEGVVPIFGDIHV
ncbi:exodeoxyribonuclease V [Rhodotorula diobovata]|uniref:Exodeoxyribonuclease V n=1 Tax=Rhodotorula diobovata TaxID=5288 RepID=A0A5C5FVY3_9BASI|nr:exodeoxyribonuclease V [Rhodotorula diobovata]